MPPKISVKKSQVPKKSKSSMPPLVVVGTVAVDAIQTPFGRKDKVFGGSASYFSYASSFFTEVALVAVVGKDFPDSYRKILQEKPIDLSHLETLEGKTFSWSGKYEFDMNSAQTLQTDLNVLTSFNPKLRFPETPDYLFLANVDPELQLRVLDQIEKPRLKFVACDTMNFWIQNKKKHVTKLLGRVDCVVLNDGEARQLTGEVNLVRAAQKVKEMGPDYVVIKKGEHGVLAYYQDQFFSLPAFPLETVKDPTGAGDTFAGGFMGYLVSQGDVSLASFKTAIAYGTIMASFTVEDFGLEALRRLAFEDFKQRLEMFRKLSSF